MSKMPTEQKIIPATIEIIADADELHCKGDWTVAGISHLEKRINTISFPDAEHITLNTSDIIDLDSAGALLLQNLVEKLEQQQKTVKIEGLTKKQKILLELVAKRSDEINKPLKSLPKHGFFYFIGEQAVIKWDQILNFLDFVGEATLVGLQVLLKPRKLQWRAFLNAIDQTGYQALPIIALLSFLVGVVLTYQMGIQLKNYGANIFIVNLSGIAVLREFGPLITAIIAAGRTSSAFTAEIGTMKVNEEIDALKVMGLSPMNLLVLPKIFGLLIALPLLTVWSDVFGVLGSMMMTNNTMDIGYADFMRRFLDVVDISNYYVGLSKTPVFAFVIATVGCFQGFRVGYTADSVGRQTTRAVVQSIFLIIIVDSAFSVYFSWQGI
jgi:phospholipid/cholesterol/gamma-HCH transport system permease protein